MRLRSVVLFGLISALLGACYYWIVIHAVPEIFIFARSGLWLQKVNGVPHGMTIWLELLHTIAIAIAAGPVAFCATVALKENAVLAASVAAAIGLTLGLVPSLGIMLSLPRPPTYEVAVLVFDHIKVLVFPALLVLLIRRLWSSGSPNMRSSGRAANKLPVALLRRAAQLWR
jgi:hypothetical protein